MDPGNIEKIITPRLWCDNCGKSFFPEELEDFEKCPDCCKELELYDASK